MDVKLTMLTVEDLIWDKQWDDAFEFVKTLIQKGVPSGAPLVTRLVKLTKWYDQGLALLKLKKDDIPEYMENYLQTSANGKIKTIIVDQDPWTTSSNRFSLYDRV